MVNHAPADGLRGLWIGPYLTDVFDATVVEVGTVTSIMVIAMIAGSFFMDRLIVFLAPESG